VPAVAVMVQRAKTGGCAIYTPSREVRHMRQPAAWLRPGRLKIILDMFYIFMLLFSVDFRPLRFSVNQAACYSLQSATTSSVSQSNRGVGKNIADFRKLASCRATETRNHRGICTDVFRTIAVSRDRIHRYTNNSFVCKCCIYLGSKIFDEYPL
jgi:hypothetical protein